MKIRKKLIDADALLETILDTAAGLADCEQQNAAWALRKYAVRDIKDAPKVDAVEVVRCKDCIHAVEIEKDYIRNLFIEGTKQCELGRGDQCIGYSIIIDDGFCDSGERRSDG